MDTFATVSVLLALIALGMIVIQLFTASKEDRLATLPSGRPRRWRLRPRHRTEK
ncbi:hypothetical protein SAMN05428944_3806 [Streptomyces sp. 1222.5]|uniref:hypothetical protein n=1 Tax=unclassified Streptomyces TaxID=2593676 RepID=UPI0008948414|nr:MULTISPECIES: hypothetical protein [unclassified Streptomyces]PKW09048.1 hypothetical protein BX260_4288 [Streptomyces sp. 5112.2]SEC46011.1 hypothetical protein SAMN05428944_3806 [Streptomyces sp. 1222.5]SED43652.1 hypothetical protein SAMN05216532_4542 [Streptomyces sp. 2231.1]